MHQLQCTTAEEQRALFEELQSWYFGSFGTGPEAAPTYYTVPEHFEGQHVSGLADASLRRVAAEVAVAVY